VRQAEAGPRLLPPWTPRKARPSASNQVSNGVLVRWRSRRQLIQTMAGFDTYKDAFPHATGVAALALVLLGGATWMRGGFWAPDGAYSRLVSPIIGLTWVVVVSRILLTRSPATRTGW
jgi:hypothetical protein